MSTAMKKCLDNGIKIYPKPINRHEYILVVNINDIEKPGVQTFRANPTKKDPKWYDKIHSLYETLASKL